MRHCPRRRAVRSEAKQSSAHQEHLIQISRLSNVYTRRMPCKKQGAHTHTQLTSSTARCVLQKYFVWQVVYINSRMCATVRTLACNKRASRA